MRIALAIALVVGCKGPGDSGVDETDTDTVPGETEDTDPADTEDVIPVVSDLDAWCWEHTVGDVRWLWKLTATGEDPQGTPTLADFGHSAVIERDGSEVTTYLLVCEDDGDCTGNWNEAEFGILCAEATRYTIRVTLEDDDGNWSLPIEVQGRAGAGEDG